MISLEVMITFTASGDMVDVSGFPAAPSTFMQILAYINLVRKLRDDSVPCLAGIVPQNGSVAGTTAGIAPWQLY